MGREDGVDGGVLIEEVRHEHFDDNTRIGRTHGFDGLAKMFRAAVRQIVPRYRGDDDVFELQAARGLRHAGGLVPFQREGLGGGDGAKAAGSRATITGDHERSRAFAPAFPMVRAPRALANGVEAEVFQEAARLEEGVMRGQFQT